jgi:hypothetical protein
MAAVKKKKKKRRREDGQRAAVVLTNGTLSRSPGTSDGRCHGRISGQLPLTHFPSLARGPDPKLAGEIATDQPGK